MSNILFYYFSENKLIVEDCQEVVQNLFQESLTDSLLEYTPELSVLSYAINSILNKSPILFNLVCFKFKYNLFYLFILFLFFIFPYRLMI